MHWMSSLHRFLLTKLKAFLFERIEPRNLQYSKHQLGGPRPSKSFLVQLFWDCFQGEAHHFIGGSDNFKHRVNMYLGQSAARCWGSFAESLVSRSRVVHVGTACPDLESDHPTSGLTNMMVASGAELRCLELPSGHSLHKKICATFPVQTESHS